MSAQQPAKTCFAKQLFKKMKKLRKSPNDFVTLTILQSRSIFEEKNHKTK